MHLPFKELRTKILAGDFSNLFKARNQEGYVHPSIVAKLFISISTTKAIEVFKTFPSAQQVTVFPYLDNLLQKQIIKNIPKNDASNILNQQKSDDRNIYFSTLKGLELSNSLSLLNEENRAKLEITLGYNSTSVARIINTDFASVERNMTIAQAIVHLRQNHTDTEAANVIYVVDDEGKLIDDVPVRRLILNDPVKQISTILDGFCTRLFITETKGDAVQKFKEFDRTVLPVVNKENTLLGVITVDDVMDIQEQKDTAEIQKFGGVEELDYPYVNTPFFSLLKKRASWLIILFLSEMLTATAMGGYADEISKAVVLALFVPLVMSSGGNSGSQAATLIIRAMALKELGLKDWWYVMRREFLSGLVLGIILGSIGFIRIAIWQQLHWYDYGVHWMLIGITIFFSLIGIILWGTLSGSMVPMILRKFGVDPATSSAPFIATLVDVTGLVIYFSIAALFLKGTLL